MNKSNLLKFWLLALTITFCFATVFTHPVTDAMASSCDPDPPIITITAPASGGGSYVTDQSTVNLAGDVDDAIGVKEVTWSNDRGGSGIATATINIWTGPWRWEAKGISLSEGDNLITVRAVDAEGNFDISTLTVTYNVPTPPPTVKTLKNSKAKFTFFWGGTGYENLERCSDVAYLLKNSSEAFVMPFNKDVTVTIRAPDPRNPSTYLQLFTQTIPAGTVSESSYYKYTSGPGGIRELRFQPYSSTAIYAYVYVEEVEFLPDIKPTMTPAEYQAFVRSIRGFILDVQMDGLAWSGAAPLVPGTYTEHKQELVYNR